MWKHEVGKRHPVVSEIDLALAKAMTLEWEGIMIALRWPRYEVVLRYQLMARGLNIEPALQGILDSHPERAPLKAYRGFGLSYITRNRLACYVSGRDKGGTQNIMLVPLPDPAWAR